MRGTEGGRRERGREAKAKVLHGKIKVSILVWGGGGTVDYFLYLRYHRTCLTLWVASGLSQGIDGLFRETGCHIHVLTLSWLTNGLLLSEARVTARARPLQLVFPANRPKRVHGYTTTTTSTSASTAASDASRIDVPKETKGKK